MNQESVSNRSDELLDQFASALESFAKLVEGLVNVQMRHAGDLGGLKTSVSLLEDSTTKLNELLLQGGHHGALVPRLYLVEARLTQVLDDLSNLRAQYEKNRETREEQKESAEGARMQTSATLKAAVITGIFAVVASVASLLAHVFN